VLDGEILEFGDVLARRPIMFLDTEFLKAEYASHRRIGEDVSMERRLLSRIPQEAAVLFSQDVILRRKRLEQLRSGDGDRRRLNTTNRGWRGMRRPSRLLTLRIKTYGLFAPLHGKRWS
jgi:hypothetical protein